MIINASFWVAVSFFIFFGFLIYLKIPNKINGVLNNKIDEIKKELEESKKLKEEAKKLLSHYESKIDKSKKETKQIIETSRTQSEKMILNKMEKFHQIIEGKKKNAELKIAQMKENALKDIKNLSIKISIKTAENIIKNSIDKNKLGNLYLKNLEQIKMKLRAAKN
jgi:F-type H+-transporting ATPase subunit b